jgi:hypothetical protein
VNDATFDDFAEPSEAMLDAGFRELVLALPANTDPDYVRNLCRAIWLAMLSEADDAG